LCCRSMRRRSWAQRIYIYGGGLHAAPAGNVRSRSRAAGGEGGVVEALPGDRGGHVWPGGCVGGLHAAPIGHSYSGRRTGSSSALSGGRCGQAGPRRVVCGLAHGSPLVLVSRTTSTRMRICFDAVWGSRRPTLGQRITGGRHVALPQSSNKKKEVQRRDTSSSPPALCQIMGSIGCREGNTRWCRDTIT